MTNNKSFRLDNNANFHSNTRNLHESILIWIFSHTENPHVCPWPLLQCYCWLQSIELDLQWNIPSVLSSLQQPSSRKRKFWMKFLWICILVLERSYRYCIAFHQSLAKAFHQTTVSFAYPVFASSIFCNDAKKIDSWFQSNTLLMFNSYLLFRFNATIDNYDVA